MSLPPEPESVVDAAPLSMEALKKPPVADEDDYCGMPLDKWRETLAKDVAERFGPLPVDGWVQVGESGW